MTRHRQAVSLARKSSLAGSIVCVRALEYSPLRAIFALSPALLRAAGHTLSVYLPAHAQGYDAGYYDILFAELLHRYRERLSEKENEVMAQEMPRLRAHLGVVRPAGCAGLAAFAEAEPDVLEVIKLPLRTEERLEIGAPLLSPALRQLEELPPILIAVVDKEHARTFGLILDEIFPIWDVVGTQVKHSKAGGSSALSNQRKAENRARSNLAVAADEVAREIGSGAYERLYVAGPQEARSEFEKLLPQASQHLIAGHVSASLDSATLESDLHRHLSELRTKSPV